MGHVHVGFLCKGWIREASQRLYGKNTISVQKEIMVLLVCFFHLTFLVSNCTGTAGLRFKLLVVSDYVVCHEVSSWLIFDATISW